MGKGEKKADVSQYTGFADGGGKIQLSPTGGGGEGPQLSKFSKNLEGPPYVKIGTSDFGGGHGPLAPLYTGLSTCLSTRIYAQLERARKEALVNGDIELSRSIKLDTIKLEFVMKFHRRKNTHIYSAGGTILSFFSFASCKPHSNRAVDYRQ